MQFRAFQSQSEKMVFFETLFGFSKLDIFKMSKIRFPFYFLVTLFFIFQK
uniref:Uncharacterized protein n=1 Tax=viral metagenome TaxID=1070528 RepID=A0A6C0I9C9_9ZZZZ